METLPENGMIHLLSPYSVTQTVSRLDTILLDRGLTIFARVDHSGAAAAVGLQMPPTQLIIFGNPKSGTPLMLAAPTIAIDLPLKALVWQDPEGNVRLSFNSAEYLQHRHGFSQTLLPNIQSVRALLEQAVR